MAVGVWCVQPVLPSFARPSVSTFLLRVEGCLKRAWFQYSRLLHTSNLVKHLSPFRALFRAKLPKFPNSHACTTACTHPSPFRAFPVRGSPFPIPSHPISPFVPTSGSIVHPRQTFLTPVAIWTVITYPLLPCKALQSTRHASRSFSVLENSARRLAATSCRILRSSNILTQLGACSASSPRVQPVKSYSRLKKTFVECSGYAKKGYDKKHGNNHAL